MGYELVKLRQDGEPNRVHNVDDQNYFRLNQELIGRARMLSLWGAGILLNTDMLNYTMISDSLLASNPTIEEAHTVHKLSDETMTEWIKPDYETDILWNFVEFLKSCTYGVWVE